MKLINFRIKNYKSIKDSKVCYVDPKITILAGKNEAGKTAIVEALEDFNIDRNIREEAKPIYNKSLEPEIELEIELDKEDLKKIIEEFKIEQVKENKISIKVKKIFPKNYNISEDLISIFVPEKRKLTKIISKSIMRLKEKLANFPLNEKIIDEVSYIPELENYTPQFKEDISQEEQNKIKEEIVNLTQNIKRLNSIQRLQYDLKDFILKNFSPNFILFKTFEDILPNQIPIAEATNSPLIKDLSLISDLDFQKIQPSAAPDDREKHKEEVNLKFRNEYQQFWTQDHSNLYFWWDSNNIYFRIKEGSEFYPIAMRSKGRQWHLAYYIRLTARSLGGKNNIILIDEPGLFLHAKAQKDILKKLEECAGRTQIIFTTHSPYLISSDKLSRLRLVIKDEKKGTRIEKITAKADKETLTPILTAIGEDLSAGIRVDKKNSIVVEGYSDYLWLVAFKKLLNIDEELNFVPAVGADSSLHVGSILFGWGLDPIFILDNDEKGKGVKRKLREKLGISEERIIFVPENKKGCIEDMFSKEDYAKYVMRNKNSKTLLATLFYQRVERGEIKPQDLTEETKDNFKKLFQKLIQLTKINN